jgi:hypothetical protein
MFVAPVCFAAELDAPAQKQVTVRSEIQRGHDAIFQSCLNFNAYNVPKVLNISEKVLNKNSQNNTDTDAFLLGAYYTICQKLNWAISSKGNTEDQVQTGKDQLAFYYKKFREKQQLLSIDDNQFSEAIGVNYEFVKKDFDRWDYQVNGVAASQ